MGKISKCRIYPKNLMQPVKLFKLDVIIAISNKHMLQGLKMSKATHTIDFGFGKIVAQKSGHYFNVIESHDPMIPANTKFPVNDTLTLEAKVIELE
ncbi:hypothetical protein FDI46_gp208 [Aeromonas phage AS-gz]|uniref:Uncharacterized protein n=3 Tax=Tulanevirus TaxID=2560244 RepID=A0A898KA14_9CAUD|nr:hypothetical protein FDI46_gp208 [Aeromonas phage AS-gz]ASU00744.1 hypothetical protein [Aeromonas phage AS-gz]QSJ03503.1 hypothetical protein [Aeromonas phage vB_AsM_ZHF]